MTDEIAQLLKSLHLRAIAECLDDEVAAAEKAQLSYQEWLARLLRAQWNRQQESALAWRIDRAKLPEKWSLESFPFKQQPGVQQRQIRALADLDFVPKAENIVFIGPTGVGKTGLASGILLKAIQNGYRGLFVRAQDLFDEMYASLADRSSRKLIAYLARVDVLVIDEMGYLNLRPEQTNISFKLMEERYRRRATIVTTNLEFDEWHQFLGNKPLVDALLSRLLHQCHTIRIKGPSLRAPKSDPEARPQATKSKSAAVPAEALPAAPAESASTP
jgi:DNA replication protein DnaC